MAVPQSRRVQLDRYGWSILGLIVAAWTTTLIAAPILPLQDIPDWTYQGWLLDRLLAGDPRAAVELKPYPVPNTLVTLIAAILVPLAGPETAGRLLAILALGSVAAGAAALATAARAGGWAATILFAILGLSTPFLLGYVAFTLGLGLLALALATERSRQLSARAVLGWSVLLFFTHAIPFFVFVLTIGWHHAIVLRARASAAALLPSLALAIWYAAARLLGYEPAGASEPASATGALTLLWEQLRWKPFTAAAAGPWRDMRVADHPLIPLDALGTHWLLAFNLIFTAALVAIVARALSHRATTDAQIRLQLVPPAVLIALFVAAPPIDFFGLINAGERFWLAACLLLLPLARPRPGLLAVLVVASLPVHAMNLTAIWRAGDRPGTAVPADTPWHPFIVRLGDRPALNARIVGGDPQPIAPGYQTGILRNR
jgi:hypothetical protein